MEDEKLLYSKFLSLPLFLGMTQNALDDIIAHTKFDFQKIQKGNIILHEHDLCNSLVFLNRGIATMRTRAFDNTFAIEETINPPTLFEPERLFGLSQYYFSTYVAKSECNVIKILKNDVFQLVANNRLCLINLLNMVSARSQHDKHNLWIQMPNGIIQKITYFVVKHSLRPTGEKTVYITMEDLSDKIHESRLHVSQAIHKLESLNLINFKRGIINVPHLENLISHSNSIK